LGVVVTGGEVDEEVFVLFDVTEIVVGIIQSAYDAFH
jgi:hypothetical protein